MYTKNDYCSYCGYKFTDSKWPRTCAHCKHMSFINPLPCTVSIIPVVGSGIVVIRRGIQPQKGEFALPGGYLDVGETWEEGAAREIKEEVGLTISPEHIKLKYLTVAKTTNSLLIFCRTREVSEKELYDNFSVNEESLELLVVKEPMELAFPTHTKALSEYFLNLRKDLSSVIA